MNKLQKYNKLTQNYSHINTTYFYLILIHNDFYLKYIFQLIKTIIMTYSRSSIECYKLYLKRHVKFCFLLIQYETKQCFLNYLYNLFFVLLLLIHVFEDTYINKTYELLLEVPFRYESGQMKNIVFRLQLNIHWYYTDKNFFNKIFILFSNL